MNDLQEMIDENPSLRGYIQGYLAERALKTQLLNIAGVSAVRKIPDMAPEKGDFEVIYKNVPLTIECKSVKTGSVKEDVLTQSWMGTVGVCNTDKREITIEGFGNISTSKLIRGQFDILAISCFAVNGEWSFMFIENRFLPSAEEHRDLLKSSFIINPATTPGLTEDISRVLEKALEIKAQAAQEEELAA